MVKPTPPNVKQVAAAKRAIEKRYPGPAPIGWGVVQESPIPAEFGAAAAKAASDLIDQYQRDNRPGSHAKKK
jgi:hypothetical protein